ncbi:putative NBD/HSP70 family sugar kinase [Kitasatospora gansuensis]|uniref:Putative NBD/HSP70 family sugar kinase n=1 Tax=Kitasatospora gansuensis TaxID=258050 RepID=A0A7W7S876_9ACTN|nr:ROK family protein [Kitasatospora gansuensis]MBB4945709.1 putative NBD/HSP70 family sugar kinase [Kitasatospora gansuensis]
MTPSSTRAVPAEAAHRNAATVLRTVLAHGPLPRLRIAELTGISAGTVSRLTARLAAAGQLVELPAVPGPTETGRPRVPLDLPLTGTAVAGVHIGLLRTTLGLVDLRGGVLAQLVIPRGSTDPGLVVTELADTLGDLTTSHPTRRLLGVGVSTGGWVDTEAGTVVEHGPLGWRDVPLYAELTARLDHPVRLDGLVRALALAEGWYGAGQRADSLLELFVGNVVGAAFTVARQIHHGPRSAAGGIAHLRLPGVTGAPCECGHDDCLQAALADHSILRLAVAAGLVGPDEPYEELVRRAQDGATEAAGLLRTRARWIGRAAATLLDLVNPELVVLAGGPLLTPEYLPDTRAELVRHSALGPAAAARLVPSGLGGHSLVLSSAAVFLDAWFSDPLAHAGAGGDR